MAEAEDVLRKYFSDGRFVWELKRDPEGGLPELWLTVHTQLHWREARLMLDYFDQSYWLAVCNQRGFSVTFESNPP